MSKYSKLSDDVIIKKLKANINNDLSYEITLELATLFENFNRSVAEELCTRLETINKEIKDRKKAEELERKKIEDLAKSAKAATGGDDEEIINEKEKEYKLVFTSEEVGAFTEIKNGFGIRLVDENESPIYPSLHEQFKSIVLKYPRLKFYRLSYSEQSDYNPDREFMHVNLNSGFISQFEKLSKYLFGCFRLIVNPLTNKCLYNSLLISCIEEPISELLTDIGMFELFTSEEISGFDESERNREINMFLDEFQKTTSNAVLSEKYLRK